MSEQLTETQKEILELNNQLEKLKRINRYQIFEIIGDILIGAALIVNFLNDIVFIFLVVIFVIKQIAYQNIKQTYKEPF